MDGIMAAKRLELKLYGGGDRERDQRVKQWREQRIVRFVERQRVRREWINFAEIAEWCSKEDGSILPNEKKRAAAYDTLACDLLAGDFVENGRSRVLYLHPATSRSRMTCAWLADAIANNYDHHQGRSAYLAHCWMPRSFFDRWLIKNRLPESPPRFQPAIASDESAVIEALAAQLRSHPQLKFNDAVGLCRKAGFEFSMRGFRNRIWAKAREQAGLPAKAKAGRKSTR